MNLQAHGDDWTVSHSSLFNPGERVPGIQHIGGWVGSECGGERKKKFLPLTEVETPQLI
jgi:hypothetical protein